MTRPPYPPTCPNCGEELTSYGTTSHGLVRVLCTVCGWFGARKAQ